MAHTDTTPYYQRLSCCAVSNCPYKNLNPPDTILGKLQNRACYKETTYSFREFYCRATSGDSLPNNFIPGDLEIIVND